MKWQAGVIVIGVVVLFSYVLHPRARATFVPASVPVVAVGDHFSLPGVTWSVPAGRTLVIVTSGRCPSCAANQSFNDVLVSRAHALHLPVIYLLNSRHSEDVEANRLQKSGETVSRGILGRLGVALTPTALAVDSHGDIVGSWVGTVPPSRMAALVAELTAGRGVPPYRKIARTAIETIAKSNPGFQVLGLTGTQADSPFGSHYKVIPASELVPRARYELRSAAATVVDCEAANSVIECQSALTTLSQIYQFKQLFAVGLPPK